MEELDYIDEDPWGTVFRDVILLALVGFVAMVILLLPHITVAKKESEQTKVPGNVIVEMHWPSNQAVDVDLWVKAPGEFPVGFWNQGGEIFNLLRDDLGIVGDATDENYEIVYSRGIPQGEYIVNVHMYGPLPPGVTVPVNVVVSVRKKYDDTNQILKTNIKLTRRNQEETAFRFKLTGDGDLVPGSVSTLRRSLITGQ
ncbi:MAG: hypothetical protein ACE10M_04330 [Alphaproteobacteria bacterium]|nr:hypothetical protein [Pseudomonadota bacterium]MCZ6483192.1 hypothetical protein [Alphaproteobacteria bacterium]MCZ6744744.1 hypothetical protein [Alphaproteobacteria bacterium]